MLGRGEARGGGRDRPALLSRGFEALIGAVYLDGGLEAQLGQNSANSSRPPSSDRPPVPPKRRAVPSGRKRGGQPGHHGAYRTMLSVEQVDEIVAVVPERC